MRFDDKNISEINSLIETIEKIKKKYIFSYLGMLLGAVLMIFALLYFSHNTDLVAGVLSILFIGFVVIFINYISLKGRKKRVQELTQDLEKSKEVYDNTPDF